METKRVYTKATERLKRLHKEYCGLKSGKPEEAVFFSNTDVEDMTVNFSADDVDSGYFTRRAYEEVTEEEFVKFMGLESTKNHVNYVESIDDLKETLDDLIKNGFTA